MGKPYQHLQEPLKIGSVVLKNRLLSSNALPHFLSGPEPFPSEEIIQYQARIAKNGAAIVTTMDWSDSRQRNGPGDSCHFPMFNLEDPAVQNYMNQLADAIHFYHSKASVAIMPLPPKGYGVMDAEHGPFWPNELPDEPLPPMPAPDDDDMPGGMPLAPPCTAMGEEQMQELIQKCVNTAKLYQSFGFDMITIHMSYQATILAQFLSPMANRRQDQYGGSVENRARFPLMLCKAMKDACGKDFLIEAQVSGEESPGGISLQDTVEFAKLAEGIIDILQLRAGDGTANHPTGFNSTEDPLCPGCQGKRRQNHHGAHRRIPGPGPGRPVHCRRENRHGGRGTRLFLRPGLLPENQGRQRGRRGALHPLQPLPWSGHGRPVDQHLQRKPDLGL